MNDIVDAVKNEENQKAVKGFFRQIWADFKENSWQTNVVLGVWLLITVLALKY